MSMSILGHPSRNPFGDKALCETDESFQRANSPVSDIMAVEILLDCYQLSNEKAFEGCTVVDENVACTAK